MKEEVIKTKENSLKMWTWTTQMEFSEMVRIFDKYVF